jgi:cytoskeletal protein RodZ
MKLDQIRKMVKGMVKVLPFYFFTFLPLTISAQTFTQRLQKSVNGATVTVHQDKAIDDLVNGPNTPIATKKSQPEKTASSVASTTPTSPTSSTTPTVPTSKPAPTDTASVAHKSSHSIKTTGFRVQVFAGGNSRKDKQTAERMGNELRTLFPHEAVYVHFYSPRWICRMGNYRTQEEAHRALVEVKKLGYTSATIVKGKITIPY